MTTTIIKSDKFDECSTCGVVTRKIQLNNDGECPRCARDSYLLARVSAAKKLGRDDERTRKHVAIVLTRRELSDAECDKAGFPRGTVVSVCPAARSNRDTLIQRGYAPSLGQYYTPRGKSPRNILSF